MTSTAIWTALFRQSPDGLLELTSEGRIIRANHTFLGWVGLPHQAVQGRLLTELVGGGVGFPLTQPVWAGFVRLNGPQGSRLVSLTLTCVQVERSVTVIGIARVAPDVVPLRETIRRTRDELETTQLVTVNTLARLAEYHSQDTAGHLDRIRLYTYSLATSYSRGSDGEGRLTEAEVIEISRCAVVHDVGKIAVPEALLLKSGPLSASQQAVVESHTLVGERILSSVDTELKLLLGVSSSYLGTARAVARHHHERWDGQGYPDGLAGEAIPLAARIVAVADAYDYLTARAVSADLAHSKAYAAIASESGKRFDPDVVNAFLTSADLFLGILYSVIDGPVTTGENAG
ncbi:MAG TPA: HD domain-containing phosphohydrolase [Symbiobacteriaceae bacterium]|nr:HD domain-containing phosphohydrolase [Symbiobacteriaceae bacterium]